MSKALDAVVGSTPPPSPTLVKEQVSIRQKWIAEMNNLRVLAALVGGFSISRFDPSFTNTALETAATICFFITFHAATCCAVTSTVIAQRLNFKTDSCPMFKDRILRAPRILLYVAVAFYVCAMTIWGTAGSEGALRIFFGVMGVLGLLKSAFLVTYLHLAA
eukprot:TRINITY_DN86271_c0_g1_i1.p1 TRINITY_DN86271_c0_g1~~TRINITY_DN86271_c0_g1_i1.p1  ORF type:complete len:162 (-),score=11.83 TRINITY_DN86271_c0_g1_i1:258-743(-)